LLDEQLFLLRNAAASCPSPGLTGARWPPDIITPKSESGMRWKIKQWQQGADRAFLTGRQ